VRSKQAAIEFRGFTPQQRDTLSSALGTSLAIQEAPWICVNYVVPNTKKPPFDDVRVRQALTLAIDRYAGSTALQKITIVKDVADSCGEGPVRTGRRGPPEDRGLRHRRRGEQSQGQAAARGRRPVEPDVQIPQPKHHDAL